MVFVRLYISKNSQLIVGVVDILWIKLWIRLAIQQFQKT